MKTVPLILFLSCTLIPCGYGAVSDTYQEDDVSISFKRVYFDKDLRRQKVDLRIDLNLKVLADNKIIRPTTRLFAAQISISDNFGNDLGYRGISPVLSGSTDEDGLRPGEEKIFTITFSVEPLENTKYLLIKIPGKVFGNINPFELKISNPVIEPFQRINRFQILEPFQTGGEVQTNEFGDPIIKTFRRPEGFVGQAYLGVIIGLSVLCSLALIYFLRRKIVKKMLLCCNSFSLLSQRAKQKLVCRITKNYKLTILWLGITLFTVWSFVASFSGLYLRTFIPVALAIITLTCGFIYTFRNKDCKKDKTD